MFQKKKEKKKKSVKVMKHLREYSSFDIEMLNLWDDMMILHKGYFNVPARQHGIFLGPL